MQIHDCAQRGDIAGIVQQLTAGVDINVVDPYSLNTPLIDAAFSADIATVKFLVEKGADVNEVNGKRITTALDLAMRSGNPEKIQFLLERSDKDYALKVASKAGNFQTVRSLLTAGADLRLLQWTDLMRAIALGSLADVQGWLDREADLTARDLSGRTPWLLSLHTGDLSKAQLLLSVGVDREEQGEQGKTPFMYAMESGNLEVFRWLIEEGFDIEATDEWGKTVLMVAAERGASEFVEMLLEWGANPSRVGKYHQSAIGLTTSIEIMRKLVVAGEDLSEINPDMRRLLIGCESFDAPPFQSAIDQYVAGRYRRFGTSNPERMEMEFWKEMVRCNASAYTAQQAFDDTEQNFDRFWNQRDTYEPVWCCQRYERSITELPDGRIVEIGGAHEDFYDPDFCIYNDVIIYQGDGTFQIFGYPKDVFPPTDYHTATLVENAIYIIGNLGYSKDREIDETPVYRLNLDTFAIEKVETTGNKPGWISEHRAYYEEPAKIRISGGKHLVMTGDRETLVENTLDYTLDLSSLSWSRVKSENLVELTGGV